MGSSTNGGSASPARALASLARMQDSALAELRDPASDHGGLLSTLMISNALLELSKLSSAHLSLVEFAHAAAGSLVQCALLESATIDIEALGLPAVHGSAGESSGPPAASAAATATTALFVPTIDGPVGRLTLVGVPPSLIEASLLERTAEHLSGMLDMLFETERLRRAAACAHTIELIANLSEDYTADDLTEIVTAVQMLPGAEAASALIEVPRFAGPLRVDTGIVLEGSETSIRSEQLDHRGRLTLQLWWSSEGQPSDSRFDEVAERLVVGLSRAEQTTRLLEEAEIDVLTNLGNRRRAARALAQARARCGRDGEEYALLMLDLDRFKSVNDQYGHPVGDDVLRALSRAIEAVVRGYDTVARWGGEEFLIVCPGTGLDGACALAERLLVETPSMCATALPPQHRQTVSIGIAVASDPAIDAVELLRAADEALYVSKSEGRDRYSIAPSQRRSSGRR